ISFCSSGDREDLVKARITQLFGYNISNECVSGHLNILNWSTLYTVLLVTLPVAPGYTAILMLRRGIAMKLQAERHMSEYTRRMHHQLLQAIAYQACIPIFHVFAVSTYALGQFQIINHPILEYSTFTLVSFVSALSPVSSFYFIRPYRKWLKSQISVLSKSISYFVNARCERDDAISSLTWRRTDCCRADNATSEAYETRPMSAPETRHMSASETRQLSVPC
ncbi:unnamed protein product, partial [Strongylus vulgaris]